MPKIKPKKLVLREYIRLVTAIHTLPLLSKVLFNSLTLHCHNETKQKEFTRKLTILRMSNVTELSRSQGAVCGALASPQQFESAEHAGVVL